MGRVTSRVSRNLPLWALLVVYCLLLIGTGYVAFFSEAQQYTIATDADHLATVRQLPLEETDARRLFFDNVNKAGSDAQKRRETALQSFYIVLGALLGFLSAVYTSTLGKAMGDEPKDTKSGDESPESTSAEQ